MSHQQIVKGVLLNDTENQQMIIGTLSNDDAEISGVLSSLAVKGDPGRGIVSIDKTAEEGSDATYTITYTDGTTSEFHVLNGRIEFAFGQVLVGTSIIAADAITDAIRLLAGANVILTPDVDNKAVTISANVPTRVSDLVDDVGYQTKDNLVTSISASSTDTQYPSAKSVYDELQDAASEFANTFTGETGEVEIVNGTIGIVNMTSSEIIAAVRAAG